MAHTAVIDPAKNLVVNVIEAGPGFALDDFTLVASDTAAIGLVYDPTAGTFGAPSILASVRRDNLCAAVRAKRKAVEAGGTSLNGIPLATDETSILKISGAVALFDKDPTLSIIDFEAAPGVWVALDRPTMTAIAVKTGRHVQAAFSRARELDETLAVAPDDAITAVDPATLRPAGPRRPTSHSLSHAGPLL